MGSNSSFDPAVAAFRRRLNESSYVEPLEPTMPKCNWPLTILIVAFRNAVTSDLATFGEGIGQPKSEGRQTMRPSTNGTGTNLAPSSPSRREHDIERPKNTTDVS
jgi:hypothetical protein